MALAGSFLCILTAALPFWWLWNRVLVRIFEFHAIDYLQAVGLLTLIALATAAGKGMSIALKFRDSR